MWHKADWMGHPMRLELTLAGLLVKLANHYTTWGALVKQQLVITKLRVQCYSDYPSIMQMVSHVIVSRWLVYSVWRSRWRVFMEDGVSII